MINNDFINKPERVYKDGEDTVIELKALSSFDYDAYDLEDPKSFRQFLNDLKRIVRTSFEYRQLINYLKNTAGMDECSILENVSSRDNSKVKIELHHAPMTLEDICLAVVRKRIDKHEDLNINACAHEVMYLHYKKWVGLIPLSVTAHELVHNAYYFIPVDKMFGDYTQFVNSGYYNYIDPSVLDAIDNAEQATKDFNTEEQNQIFNNHRIYVRIEDDDRSKFYDLKNPIHDRIESIKTEQSQMSNTNPNINSDKRVMCRIVNK